MKLDFIKDDSKREQFLLMLFPGALILAIYSVLFAVPMRQEKSKVEAEFIQESRSSVSTKMAEISRQNLSNERDSLDRLRNRVSLSKQQMRDLSQGWRSRQGRLETLEKITNFMRDYNLSIVSQGGNESAIVSSYLQDLFRMMNEQAIQEPVEFWPVEVKGAYFDVLVFLKNVNTLVNIIPVAITMKPESEGSAQKTWTIVFVF
ncbi:MAG: hypothetical protein AB8B55_01040 [Mariniblastus sp.]